VSIGNENERIKVKGTMSPSRRLEQSVETTKPLKLSITGNKKKNQSGPETIITINDPESDMRKMERLLQRTERYIELNTPV